MIEANELEIFKTIASFPDYEVSNFGRIKTKARKVRYVHAATGQEHFRSIESKFMKLWVNGSGYYFTSLRKGNKGYNKVIHRLVANTFLATIEGKNIVNHIDGNKLNNCVENLEWCTDEYNHEHATKNGLKPSGSRIGTSKLNERCIIAIRKLLAKGWTHGSVAELFDVSKSAISLVSEGKTWNTALTGSELTINLEKVKV